MPMEVAEGVMEVVLEPLLEEAFKSRVHRAEEAFVEGEQEEEVPKTLAETGEAVELQHEMKDINEVPPSILVRTKIDPSPEAGHVVPASFAPGSSSETGQGYPEFRGVSVS